MPANPCRPAKIRFIPVFWAVLALLASFTTPSRAVDGIVFRMPSNLEGEEVKRLAGKITEGVLGLKRGADGKRERLVVVIDFNPESKPDRQADFEACLKLSRVLVNLDPADVLTVGFIRGETSRFGILPDGNSGFRARRPTTIHRGVQRQDVVAGFGEKERIG